MSIFALGDTHLSLGPDTDKSMDIFPGWTDYVSRIETHWKALVKPEDTVVIPGDISWAMSLEQAKSDFEFLHSLPGKKIILKGNHDYWWNTMTKMNRFLEENGFDSIRILHNNAYEVEGVAICGTRGWFFDDDVDDKDTVILRECGRLQMSIDAAKEFNREIIVFIHYPPLTGDRECTQIMDVLRKNEIKTVYYAHLHGNAINYAFRGERDGISFNLVSGDSLNFYPYLIKNG